MIQNGGKMKFKNILKINKKEDKSKYYLIAKTYECSINEIKKEVEKYRDFIEKEKWPPNRSTDNLIDNISLQLFNYPTKIDVKKNKMANILEIEETGPTSVFELFVEYAADKFKTENFEISSTDEKE